MTPTRIPLFRGPMTKSSARQGVVFLLSSGESANRLYVGQFAHLQHVGFPVTVVCPGGAHTDQMEAREGVPVWRVSMRRSISPITDIRSLLDIIAALSRLRPAVVVYGTPKAALLGALAAVLLRVPVRVYVLHGLRLETLRGWGRRFLLQLERLIARCSTEVWPVSPSLAGEADRLRIGLPGRSTVLGAGSCNGVDIDRFAPSPFARHSARRALGLSEKQSVLLFIGRLTRDKGVPELLMMFEEVRHRHPLTQLVLVGSLDPNDPLPPDAEQSLSQDSVHMAGEVDNPETYLWAADCLVLPTYREGMPGVLLEAAAAGCPIVTTTATGARDVGADGRALTVVPGDVDALVEAVVRVLDEPEVGTVMASRARNWVEKGYSQEAVWANTTQQLAGLLESTQGVGARHAALCRR